MEDGETTEASLVQGNEDDQYAFGDTNSNCRCGRPARLLVSRTVRNPGRKFWGCSHQGGHCNFFKWHDEWVNERSLVVLREMRRLSSNLETFRGEIHTKNNRENKKMMILDVKVKKLLKEVEAMKRSRDIYKIGFYVVASLFVCKLYFR